MTLSTVRLMVFLTALMVSVSITSAANAGTMFTVTNLGSSYTLQQDASGTVSSVTSGDGSQVYAFDKSPTTSIDQLYYADGVSQFPYVHEGGFLRYTLQNGSLKGGYYLDPFSGQMAYPYFPQVPIGFYFLSSWHNELMPPVADMNSHGEIVGTSVLGATSNYGAPTYAAFSAATGGTHDLNNANSSVADNLNNYIASSLGINLTQGLKVDDLGDIIAEGTLNGKTQDFLLTLNGPPIPAPEPSTLAFLAVVMTALGIRSAHQQNKKTAVITS